MQRSLCLSFHGHGWSCFNHAPETRRSELTEGKEKAIMWLLLCLFYSFHIPGRFVCADPSVKWTQRGMKCVEWVQETIPSCVIVSLLPSAAHWIKCSLLFAVRGGWPLGSWRRKLLKLPSHLPCSSRWTPNPAEKNLPFGFSLSKKL